MPRTLAVLLCLLPGLMLAAPPASAAHPNNAIIPERPPQTRYGQTIVRGDDDRAAFSPSAPPVDSASLGAYVASVSRMEHARGPYAPGLVEPLSAIARSLQAADRHAAAIDRYRRAVHLTRVNGGLYDPAQIPLLEKLVASQVALGQLARADRTRDYLYRLQRRNLAPGSEAMLTATQAYSDWKREAYLEGFGFETFQHLLDIHRVNSRAVEAIAREDPDSPAQVPHLYWRMRAEYLMSRYEGEQSPALTISGVGYTGPSGGTLSLERERFRILRKHNFRNGRLTMERLVEVLEAQVPPDAGALARARIAQGDWYMWWDRPANAREYYEKAWALLAGDSQRAEALFAEPVELPAERVFQPAASSEKASHRARASVRFDVDQRGRVMDIEFLNVEAESEEKAESARLALYRMLRNFRFRPVLREGQVRAASGVVREYSFDY